MAAISFLSLHAFLLTLCTSCCSRNHFGSGRT